MQSTFESSKNISWFNNTLVLERLWCLYIGSYFYIFITALPRFCRRTKGVRFFWNFSFFGLSTMVISRNEKNAVFDDYPIKKLRLATTFWWLLALMAPKISIFSQISKLQIYFKQLIVKISNSEICYLGRIYKDY